MFLKKSTFHVLPPGCYGVAVFYYYYFFGLWFNLKPTTLRSHLVGNMSTCLFLVGLPSPTYMIPISVGEGTQDTYPKLGLTAILLCYLPYTGPHL
jgi:hypothetical protein